MPSLTGVLRCSRNLNTGRISVAPTAAPNAVDSPRCPEFAPSCSALTRASPAPAAAPMPPAATLPTIPSGPRAKNGAVEPTPSPSFLPTDCSYPGDAANGLRIVSAISRVVSRTDCSCSSGRREAAPATADWVILTAPGTNPLNSSFTLPPMVVLGANSGNCDWISWAAFSLGTSSGNSTVRPSGRVTLYDIYDPIRFFQSLGYTAVTRPPLIERRYRQSYLALRQLQAFHHAPSFGTSPPLGLW